MKNYWKKNWTNEEEKLRYLALKSFSYRCYFCKTNKKRLEIHHRNNWIDTDENAKTKSLIDRIENNQLDNLIVLCHSCHQRLHKILRGEKIINIKDDKKGRS